MIRNNNQHGFILMPVIIAIVLVATIAFLLNNQSALNVDETAGVLEAEQAEQVAQAGFQHALWGINNSGCSGNLTLPTTPFGNGSYTATVTSLVTSSSYTLNATQDTWLKESAPTENHGGDIELSVKAAAGDNMRALYQFDLSSIPVGSQVASATAWFYVTGNDDKGAVDIHEATAVWIEGTADWVTMNDKFAVPLIASIPAQASSAVWVQVNITSLVQSWVNGSINNGIMLLANSDAVESKYSSREAGSSQRPRIEVVATSGTASPVTITAQGTLTGNPTPANDITRTLTRAGVPAYQPTSSQVLQPGAAIGEDAEIWDQQPNNNYGDAAETWVSSASNDTTRTLLRFNMGVIPTGTRILQATLSLHRQSGSGADQPVSAHRIMNSWSEDSVTWNSRESGTNWDTAGVDFDDIAVVTTPVGPANQRYDWNISPLAQGWVDGSYPNYGVVLVAAIAGMPGQRFNTSDHGDSSLWPSLSVTYTCKCGIVCMAPQGSGNILMVVSDEWWMTQDELKKKALFESWGYTVNLISQWDVSWNFDALAVNNDVVYVSEGVDHTTWGMAPKLAATTLGVVNEEGLLNDALGISNNAGVMVGSALNVTDTSHYITTPFPAGSLEIYHADMQQLVIFNGPAPDLQVLADVGGNSALVTLETGASLKGGAIAAGRRVMLPLGTEAKFNWDYLNSNGRLMVQRAIQWGTGNTAATPSRNLLLVIAGNNPTTQEQLRIDLIESWGYGVNVIDDNDSQANFDTAVAANEVAYVPETIDAVALGTKLTAATIGVVIEEWTNDFGIATDFQVKSRDEIDIIDNTHYITSPYSLGLLTYLSSLQPVTKINSGLAPDLIPLGMMFNTGSQWKEGLAVINPGGSLAGGGTAAGRRVQLPWGDVGFDINALNAAGKDIMKRAIEWAEGAAPTANGPLAHWKLDETSGTTSVDSVGGHDGTQINGLTPTTGQLDGALQFNGTNDYINVPHDDALSLTTFSISAWIRPDTVSGIHAIVYKGASTAEANYHLYTDADEITLGLTSGGWQYQITTASANLVAGQWYHLTTTFDGASGEGKHYLDGSLIHTGTIGPSPIMNTGPITIGTDPFDEFWDGLLDDVRLYDSVLPASEIADLYTAGGGGGGGEPPPPSAGVVYEEFTQAQLGSNGDQMDITKPAGTVAGDLLIAAVATDGKQGGSGISSPTDWNLVNHGIEDEQVTLGVWWKIAGGSESSQYRFELPEDQEAYGWIMRFTGQDPVNSINVSANTGGKSNAPTSPAVITTVADTMILRIGGFDDDDISVGVPGLSGHTVITMQKSTNGNGTTSGGAGFKTQEAAGNSGTSSFSLSRSEEYRAVTIGIAPAP